MVSCVTSGDGDSFYVLQEKNINFLLLIIPWISEQEEKKRMKLDDFENLAPSAQLHPDCAPAVNGYASI